MAKFLTDEWIKEYKEVVNASKTYEEAAATWEGDFYFTVTDVGENKETVKLYMDLWHGKARDAFLVTEDKKPPKDPEFEYSGPYDNWLLLLDGKIDPIKGLMTRKFKLKGNYAKVLKATKAAKELVACSRDVQTEYD
ncbi:MAG: SCP2 sterol-binding domain-containing protein [Candidatus Hodarchaeales archaeon]|jgi:putative sterol carrier protein